ncbi:MAG TPA: hypothetical protein VEA78_02335, partial [Acidimicrobiales bacterium]|nr:hypothetical protein [Acidimicrobiales bacterium]
LYNTFPAADAVDAMRAAGVRYVVVRTSVVGFRVDTPREYRAVYGAVPLSRLRTSASRLAEIRAALPPSVREVGTYGDAVLFEVTA